MPVTRRAKRKTESPKPLQQKQKRARVANASQFALPPSTSPTTPTKNEPDNAPASTDGAASVKAADSGVKVTERAVAAPAPIAAPVTAPPAPAAAAPPQWSQPNWWDAHDEYKARQVRACLDIGSDVSQQHHASLPEGREQEAQCIQSFITSCLDTMHGGCMYISGRPGTGKSMTVHSILTSLAANKTTSHLCDLPPAFVSINCYAIGDVRDVFDHIASGIHAACSLRVAGNQVLHHAVGDTQTTAHDGGDGVARLRKVIMAPVFGQRDRRKSLTGKQSRGMFVVLLDEMDHLLQHNNAALIQQLLSLANTPGSRLVLLGVANSIDLVERILGLTSNGGGGEGHGDGSGGDKSGRDGGVSGGLRHMSFKAYTPAQIQAVLQHRLTSLPGPVFVPPALMLCARKVAAASGDMRRALEVCRKAIDHATAAAAAADGGGAAAGNAGAAPSPAPATTNTSTLIGMKEVAAALARVNGAAGSCSTRVAALRDLPLQQQLVLCAARQVMARIERSLQAGGQCGAMMGGGDDQHDNGIAPRSVLSPISLNGQKRRASIGGGTASGCVTASKRRLSLGGGRRSSFGGRFGGLPSSTATEATQADVLDAYVKICQQIGVAHVTKEEFFSMCSNMVDNSYLVLSAGARPSDPPRLQRIGCAVSAAELMDAVKDNRLLRSVVVMLGTGR